MQGPLKIKRSQTYQDALNRGEVALCVKCKGGVPINRVKGHGICTICGDIVSRTMGEIGN